MQQKIEVNWNGKEESFDTLEAAKDFGETLKEAPLGPYSYDIWVNDKLYKSVTVDFKTGKVETTLY